MNAWPSELRTQAATEHGHLAGDEALVQVSQLLLTGSRASDTVSRIAATRPRCCPMRPAAA